MFASTTDTMANYSNGPAEKDLKRDLESDQPSDLNNTPSLAGEARVHDDIFGDITDEGPNYRAVRHKPHSRPANCHRNTDTF